MSDRNKVIKGLECCASMNGSACRECPYSSECVAGETTYQTGTAHLAADALSLLKEQEDLNDHYQSLLIAYNDMRKEQKAVEPKPNHLFPGGWSCGRCGNWISRVHDYCPHCGKQVKWE